MVDVRETIKVDIRPGDAAYVYTGKQGWGSSRTRRVIVKSLDYHGQEGLATDFTLQGADGQTYKPRDVDGFGFADGQGGFTREVPADRRRE